MLESTRSIEPDLVRFFCQQRSVRVNCAVRTEAHRGRHRIEFDSIVAGQRLENVTQQVEVPPGTRIQVDCT